MLEVPLLLIMSGQGDFYIYSAILNDCFYITKFKYHLCYYLNLFAILAKGTVR